ncbi:retrovirus-related pol polyprotein from transposon TNT 1-94 [Tanacetum coccineum]
MQLNKEIFQKNNTSVNQTEHSFDHLFELNNLKAELQAKDTTIEKLKANIKLLNKTSTTNSVKKDMDEIETINIELEHREKVFVITTLKMILGNLKENDIVDNVAQVSNATTIAPGMYKLDPVTLAPKDKNNRETHIYYLKHTMEQASILREIVEQAKSLNPLDSASYSASVVTSINKKKTVRFIEPVTSSSTSQKQLGSSQTKTKQTTNIPCQLLQDSMFDVRHELCFLEFVSDMNASSKSKSVKKAKKKEDGNLQEKITATNKVPLREPIPLEVTAQESVVTKVYTRRPKVVQIVLWYLDSGCSKHMTGDRSQLTNFVHKFLGTVKFGNDQIAKIMGYGDYQIGNITISRVYYVEGLGHNLFSVGQFCDSDLEVAFRKHTCFVRNLEGVDLISGSRENNLYTLSIRDMMASSPICLLSKASKTKSWFWHRRLSHLNFGAINHLAKHGLVRGLPKLKFEKDHLCSACAMGKSKKQSHKPKSEDTNQEKLYLLHMDLCGPMRVASVNGKKYILVIVDDYSRFTWVKFLASKDEAPDFIIKFLKMIQVRLNATVRNIRTDNGTEFVNQTLRDYYEQVGISHETSVARTPQQNGVVERRNRTLVEAARTMLIFAQAPLFLWAEAIATAFPKLQTAEDLQGDALLHYDVEMELMNLILLSIPNDIYNSVDACTSAKDMGSTCFSLQSFCLVNERFGKKWLAFSNLDTFDDLFYYLQQFEKLVNVSRAKNLEKSHDPLALDDVHTNSEDPQTSAMLNQAIIQGDRVIFKARTLETLQLFIATTVVEEEVTYARNCPKPRPKIFLFADASRMEEIKELSANICLMARIQPADNTYDAGPSYDSAFISELQSSSNTKNEEQMYPTHTKIISSTLGDDQIDSDIIFDSPNGNVNSGSIEKDTHVPKLCALEQLARNPYHLGNSEISLNVRDIEDTLDDASKSQQKVNEKMDDPIAVANKQNLQSLNKERDNVKMKYQKLFNSIKKTRSQTQMEMDELIAHVSEKTYAYGVIRAENQKLLLTYHN